MELCFVLADPQAFRGNPKILEWNIGRDNFPSRYRRRLMKVILREAALLVISVAVLAGSQNSVQKAPAIPPKSLPSPNQPPTPIPNFPSTRERPLAIAADKMTVNGKTVQYRGHVRMTTDSIVVTADELDYDATTHSAKATGNVAIQVQPPGPLVVPLSQ
jgi:lipopolysaccharide assembly outer membrane protein LptD (OstA)